MTLIERRVSPFDVIASSDDELRALYDLVAAEHHELWDEDPVQPFDLWRVEVTTPLSWQRTERFVARSDDRSRLEGWCSLVLGFTETNRDHAEVEVFVRPEARRRGLASALLARAAAVAASEGRTILDGGAVTGSAGALFCEAMGAECRIVERKSRAVLSGIDPSLLDGWVARARERAEGYSLVAWDGEVPDAYLERYAALTMVMNTAPKDDLEMDDWVHTPERQRETEARWRTQGFEWWTLVARHDESDALVGYTEFLFPPQAPEAAWQEATAVDPVHRDKGLGRWLKAANCRRLLDERPHVRYIDTWNAFSNAPMLGINIAMGFEVVKSYSAYQIETAALQAKLA